jgi:hypothetical protein
MGVVLEDIECPLALSSLDPDGVDQLVARLNAMGLSLLSNPIAIACEEYVIVDVDPPSDAAELVVLTLELD